jgi:hypothetical protein
VAVKTAEFIRGELKKFGLSDYELVDVAECLLAAGNAGRRGLIAESQKGLRRAEEELVTAYKPLLRIRHIRARNLHKMLFQTMGHLICSVFR